MYAGRLQIRHTTHNDSTPRINLPRASEGPELALSQRKYQLRRSDNVFAVNDNILSAACFIVDVPLRVIPVDRISYRM
jgi:hypothetical protein